MGLSHLFKNQTTKIYILNYNYPHALSYQKLLDSKVMK